MPIKTDTVRFKGIHIKMDRQTHADFKARLVYCNVSMQEAMEEFARLVGSGNLSALRMLDRLVREKLKKELSSVGLQPYKPGHRRRLHELDPNALYDLISEGSGVDDDVTPVPGGKDEAA